MATGSAHYSTVLKIHREADNVLLYVHPNAPNPAFEVEGRLMNQFDCIACRSSGSVVEGGFFS